MPAKKIRTRTKKAAQVAVVGSLNLDYVTRVEALPKPGETVAAERFAVFRGGKGANQAVAAARQGCEVALFGAVGTDEAGLSYRRDLSEEERIDVEGIRLAPTETGSAFITVDASGANTIVVAAGANAELRRADIARAAARIERCDVVLGQFETPPAALLEAAHAANRKGGLVIVNPSPYHPAFPWDEIRTDFIVANEIESLELLGFEAAPATAPEIRERLHELRAGALVVTRGGEETYLFSREPSAFLSVPVLTVLPVDTVGAGDAFVGCFAARLAQGEDLESALRAANCAGALATLGVGAQNPIPDRRQVDRHLQFLDR
jgi:ribokinase